ncbi:hypothetical protein FJ364_02285 [Candidatus Dependentiae bacterium]|nr:hypothetical protein [Candidatus Dependentiae bacterium]
MKTRLLSMIVVGVIGLVGSLSSADRILRKDGVVYRRAVVQDLDNVLALYKDFNEDDRQKLVVYPSKNRCREMAITNAIRQQKIFVAIDPSKPGRNKIVSFCKLYKASDDEVLDLVTKELNAGCVQEKVVASSDEVDFEFEQNLIAFGGNYALTARAIKDFSIKIASPGVLAIPSGAHFFEKPVVNPFEDIFLYFGSAYTYQPYRGRGIGTTLEAHALSCVYDAIKDELVRGRRLVFMCGLVRENQKIITTHLRAFANFVCDHMEKIEQDDTTQLAFTVAMFDAKKPEYEMVDGVLVRSPYPHDFQRCCSVPCFGGIGRFSPRGSLSPSDLLSTLKATLKRIEEDPILAQPSNFVDGYGCFICYTKK